MTLVYISIGGMLSVKFSQFRSGCLKLPNYFTQENPRGADITTITQEASSFRKKRSQEKQTSLDKLHLEDTTRFQRTEERKYEQTSFSNQHPRKDQKRGSMVCSFIRSLIHSFLLCARHSSIRW